MTHARENTLAILLAILALVGLLYHLINKGTDAPCGNICRQHLYVAQLETDLQVERLFYHALLASEPECAVALQEVLADEAGGLVFTYEDQDGPTTYEVVWVQSGVQQNGQLLNICTGQPWPAVPGKP